MGRKSVFSFAPCGVPQSHGCSVFPLPSTCDQAASHGQLGGNCGLRDLYSRSRQRGPRKPGLQMQVKASPVCGSAVPIQLPSGPHGLPFAHGSTPARRKCQTGIRCVKKPLAVTHNDRCGEFPRLLQMVSLFSYVSGNAHDTHMRATVAIKRHLVQCGVHSLPVQVC